MDTSKKYVEMCEKAKEIRYADFQDEDGLIRNFHAEVNGELVWLPRQDQLQEMIFEFFDTVEKIQSIYQFIFTTHKKIGPNNVWMTDDYIMSLESMEQLWLAFVMYEKYQKVWSTTKKDWVVQQEG